jgi:hypothetical protein
MQSLALLNASGLPTSWSLLDVEDRMGYCELRKFIQPLTRRASKDEIARKFHLTLTRIRQYVVRNDENDWKRSVNCGITWVGDAIATSTRQLS